MKTIWIAGGCFWGIQAYFKKIKGVDTTEVGYLNGLPGAVTYEDVCNNSGHAEVVQLNYNPEAISLSEIFNLFIEIINPFELNKQGNDIGIQYRTGLYSKDQETIKKLQKILKEWEKNNQKSVVEIKLVKNYTKAEMQHQDYLAKNPQGYCHINLSKIPSKYKK